MPMYVRVCTCAALTSSPHTALILLQVEPGVFNMIFNCVALRKPCINEQCQLVMFT